MLKKTMYPKTSRIGNKMGDILITEKLDGSNLSIFKLNGELYIGQRNYIFRLDEIDEQKEMLYQGLHDWLKENGEFLEKELHEKAVIIGEWIGMGRIAYTWENKFFMFAKANVNEDFTLHKINYIHEYFMYPFVNREIPSFISIVPLVKELNVYPTIAELDSLYEKYRTEENRDIEGFIVVESHGIKKYVRMKRGVLEPHHS